MLGTRETELKIKAKSKRTPPNKGQLIGQKLSLTLKQVRAIRNRLGSAQKTRDLALFNLGLDSSLSACDLVRLRVGDICEDDNIAIQVTMNSTQTSNPVQFEISDVTRESLVEWIAQQGLKPDDHLFPTRLNESPHLSTRQYARIVAAWVGLIGLNPDAYGTESLRRTKPAIMYQRSKSLLAAQVLLGHTRPRSTARFLGIEANE
jgi:integrase